MRLLLAFMLVCCSGWVSANLGTAISAEPELVKPVAVKPVPGQFGSLEEAAGYYLSLPEQGWYPLPQGPNLRLGWKHPQVAELRFMLGLYGDYQRPATGRVQLNYFDLRLAKALRRFQKRHGLKADAVLGSSTRAALNVNPDIRAYQLLLNHERQRQLLNNPPQRYVQVNLPDYRLTLVDNGDQLLEMKTIVGMNSRPTPELSSEISSLVINPAWNVPRSIATQDILPKWKSDAGYLERNNIRIVSGWGEQRVWIDPQQTDPDRLYQGSDYQRLYQLPGRNNALGAIKFDFPNKEAIYLHDTPYKGLFKRQQRALSSGCIRLEDPQLLARTLIASDSNQTRLQQALQQSETRRIRLSQPVGLFLTYWTAWLDDQQRLQFREDIYQRDPQLQELLTALTPDQPKLDI